MAMSSNASVSRGGAHAERREGFFERLITLWLCFGPVHVSINSPELLKDYEYNYISLRVFNINIFRIAKQPIDVSISSRNFQPSVMAFYLFGIKCSFSRMKLRELGLDLALLPVLVLSLIGFYIMPTSPFFISGIITTTAVGFDFAAMLAAFSVVTDTAVLLFNRAINQFRSKQKTHQLGYWAMPIIHFVGTALVLSSTLTAYASTLWVSAFVFVYLTQLFLHSSAILYVNTKLANMTLHVLAHGYGLDVQGQNEPQFRCFSLDTKAYDIGHFSSVCDVVQNNKEDVGMVVSRVGG